MARVCTDGAELRDFTFWTGQSGNYNQISTSYYRSGSASYRVGGDDAFWKVFNPLSEAYFRFGYMDEKNGANRWWHLFSSTSTLIAYLKRNSTTGRLEAYVNGVLVGTSTIAVYAWTWYLIEVHYKMADAGDFEVKIDGTLEIDYAGDTKPGTDTAFNRFDFTHWGGNWGFGDDFAMNDTTGEVDNSWCGDGKVILLTPNGNGDVTQLDGSDGNQTDNYLLVDDIPDDGDTTYVESDTIDEYDLYNLSPCGLTNVDIQRVEVISLTRDTVAAGGKIALKIKTNGVEYDSSDISLLTTFTPCHGTVHRTNPQSGLAWSVADLDALQIGPKVR